MRLIVILLALTVTGCASLAGNAKYQIECPVILEDGTKATSKFTVDSGRQLSSGAKLKIPGCFEFETDSLEQGEDRTPGVLNAAGNLLGGILALFFGG